MTVAAPGELLRYFKPGTDEPLSPDRESSSNHPQPIAETVTVTVPLTVRVTVCQTVPLTVAGTVCRTVRRGRARDLRLLNNRMPGTEAPPATWAGPISRLASSLLRSSGPAAVSRLASRV